MSETSIITAVAICVCGAFITGSVAFVIKSLMNDIKQAEITAEKGMEFVRSEIFGLRKSLEAFKTEERHKDDELKVAIDNTKKEVREEARSDRVYVDQTKGELKQEMQHYWGKAENVLEARRQDVYMLHKKIDVIKDSLTAKLQTQEVRQLSKEN